MNNHQNEEDEEGKDGNTTIIIEGDILFIINHSTKNEHGIVRGKS